MISLRRVEERISFNEIYFLCFLIQLDSNKPLNKYKVLNTRVSITPFYTNSLCKAQPVCGLLTSACNVFLNSTWIGFDKTTTTIFLFSV